MRPFERRAAQAYPYFTLQTWDARLMLWRVGKKAFADETTARLGAIAPGRYRLSRVTEAGREELAPFEVAA